MTNGSFIQNDISFRPAEEKDASFAGQLLFATFPRKASFILGLGDGQQAEKIITKLFPLTNHRLSMSHTHIALNNGKRAGILIMFPGRDIERLDWRFYRLLLRQYGLPGKITIIRRGLPLVFMKECAPDEFFLSNIAVKSEMRGKGLGSMMLAYADEKARQGGYQKIALRVAIDNLDAKRFYQRHQYQIKAIDLEPNKRVAVLGPGYQSMIKELAYDI